VWESTGITSNDASFFRRIFTSMYDMDLVDGKGEGKGSSVRIFAKNRGERPGFEGLAQGTTVRIDGPRGG